MTRDAVSLQRSFDVVDDQDRNSPYRATASVRSVPEVRLTKSGLGREWQADRQQGAHPRGCWGSAWPRPLGSDVNSKWKVSATTPDRTPNFLFADDPLGMPDPGAKKCLS